MRGKTLKPAYRAIHDATFDLTMRGIEFESRQAGAHLVIHHNSLTVDFWPVTGKFIPRPRRNANLQPTDNMAGMDDLLKYIGEPA